MSLISTNHSFVIAMCVNLNVVYCFERSIQVLAYLSLGTSFLSLSLNISMVNENAYLFILLVILSEKWNLSSKGWSAMNLESFKNSSLFLNFNVFLIFVVDKFLSSKPKIIFIYHHTNHNWIISYLLHFLCGNKSWDSPTSCTRAWTPTSTRCITS